MRGRPPWPPSVPRLPARPSQSNPRGSGPGVLKREQGHVTSESGVAEVAVFGALQPNGLREIGRQCNEFNNLSHMCAYSAILRLKIIHNKPIEAVELSKIPRVIWGRVALSEIISHTDFGWDDVVQQPPISRSYLGYWAYRIYIYI